MSLKSAIVDYSAFDGMQNREGVEGFLIGANIENKAFVTYCFPLKDPWTTTSMDLLSTGKTLNEASIKKAISLIKKTKYLLYGGLEFLGFYINCSSKDQKTYETKLIVPLSTCLQQKNFPELINTYHLTDTDNTLFFHCKGSDIEKIDQKQQNVFDNFITMTSKISYSLYKPYKPEDFLDIISVSSLERALQMEKSSIITLDNTFIMNEQESIDYYMKKKSNNGTSFEFHLEVLERKKINNEESALISGEFTLKGFIHKKASVAECKKIFIEDFKGNLQKRIKFLMIDEDKEEIIEKGITNLKIFPLPSRDCIILKNHQGFYNYRCFFDKGFFDFFLNNFLINEKDLSFVLHENPDYQAALWSKYDNLYQILLKNKPTPSIIRKEQNISSIPKKTLENTENIKSRVKSLPENVSKNESLEKDAKIELPNQGEKIKYFLLALIIIGLISLRFLIG